MSDSPRPHFFIVRGDGTKVPLVAVDELPSSFHILGVPSFINDAQSQGMVSLGYVHSSRRCYIVRQDEDSPTSSRSLGLSFQVDSGNQHNHLPRISTASCWGLGSTCSPSPSQAGMGSSAERSVSAIVPWARNLTTVTKWRRPEQCDETQAIIDAVTHASGGPAIHQDYQLACSSNSHPSNSSCPRSEIIQTGRGKKVYCNYWLRKGECDYMQQGCMYKHEMPLDKPTLASLGLREVPRWYREQWPSRAAEAQTQKTECVNRPWRAPGSLNSYSSSTALAPRPSFQAARIVSSESIDQRNLPPKTVLAPSDYAPTEPAVGQERRASAFRGPPPAPTEDGSITNGSGLTASSEVNRTTPSVTSTPEKIVDQLETVHRLTTHPTKHAIPTQNTISAQQIKKHSSSEDPLANIPAMTPSRFPVQSVVQETIVLPALHGGASDASGPTFYPGVPRKSSPAHRRLFVKDGQEKFAVNNNIEVVERPKTAGSSKSNHSTGKDSPKILDIFSDLEV